MAGLFCGAPARLVWNGPDMQPATETDIAARLTVNIRAKKIFRSGISFSNQNQVEFSAAAAIIGSRPRQQRFQLFSPKSDVSIMMSGAVPSERASWRLIWSLVCNVPSGLITTGGGRGPSLDCLKKLFPNGPEAQPPRNKTRHAVPASHLPVRFFLLVFIVLTNLRYYLLTKSVSSV